MVSCRIRRDCKRVRGYLVTSPAQRTSLLVITVKGLEQSPSLSCHTVGCGTVDLTPPEGCGHRSTEPDRHHVVVWSVNSIRQSRAKVFSQWNEHRLDTPCHVHQPPPIPQSAREHPGSTIRSGSKRVGSQHERVSHPCRPLVTIGIAPQSRFVQTQEERIGSTRCGGVEHITPLLIHVASDLDLLSESSPSRVGRLSCWD